MYEGDRVMTYRTVTVAIAIIGSVAVISSDSLAQQPGPPPGYYDIPKGYDFPADKQALEQLIANGDVAALRLHVWNLFAGMTQPTPDGKHALFETWYAQDEAFQTGPVPQGSGPRHIVLRFKPPAQMTGLPGHAMPQAAGTAILSEVMFNYANYRHIRSEKLYLNATLDQLKQTGAPDPIIPDNKTIPPFPVDAISLKTVWWPILPNKITPMPIWDPSTNPQIPTGNPYQTWKNVVAVDPTRTNIPAGETTTVSFLKTPRPNSHVVSLKDNFHYVVVDAQMAAAAMANGRLRQFANDVLGRDLKVGDYVAFVGTHLTTKEIDKWVWATFWWHDHPNDGPFAQNRPASVTGVWSHYLMSDSYDLNLPKEADGKPHITFNPWLEAHFRDGIVSNCMNCHNRASSPTPNFLPIYRGDPDLNSDAAYKKGSLRTDFLWSIPFAAQ